MIKITTEKVYRTDEVETVALNKPTLEVKEGEFDAIMGPSGCGNPLLNIVGLLMTDSGSFMFNGMEVAKFNERKN
jgi:putative ABC transport system ATP-binding protein